MNKRSHTGIALRGAIAEGDVELIKELRTPNCAALDVDVMRRKPICKSCGGRVMFVRRTRRARAHWQHAANGLDQFRSWHTR